MNKQKRTLYFAVGRIQFTITTHVAENENRHENLAMVMLATITTTITHTIIGLIDEVRLGKVCREFWLCVSGKLN